MSRTVGFAIGASFPLLAGAVLGSVIDTLAPKAFRDGGSVGALATAAGFFTGFVLGGSSRL